MGRSVALGIVLVALGCSKPPPPLPVIATVPPFELIDQDGHRFSSASLHGRPWIASFIFTHCPAICPLRTEQLATLQRALRRQHLAVHFVSFSVDPERDTPQRLRRFAAQHGVKLDNWSFLTGDLATLRRTVVNGLKTGLGQRIDTTNTASAAKADYNILHSTHYVLIDQRSRIRGYYDSQPSRLEDLEADVDRLITENNPMLTWQQRLALLNAILNGTAGLIMLAGYVAIRRQRRLLHQRLMWIAFAVSSAFLVSYLTRRIAFGDTPYDGEGWLRPLYFSILITHVVLAITVVPLVLRTLYLATRNRLVEHRRIAKITFPIWLYVSVTGVVVYCMLYG